MHPRSSIGLGATRVTSSFSRVTWAALLESLFDRLLVARFVVEGEIAGRFLVQLRRAGCQRLFGRNHSRQVPVLDFDQLGRVLRRRGAVGDDHRHRVADVAHLVARRAPGAAAS